MCHLIRIYIVCKFIFFFVSSAERVKEHSYQGIQWHMKITFCLALMIFRASVLDLSVE